MTRLLLIAFALFSVLPLRAEEKVDFFEKIPITARLVVGIRSIDELKKKGDVFLKEVEWEPMYRPTQIFDLLMGFSGLGNAPDPKQPLAFVLVAEQHLEPRGGWFGDLQIVAMFPCDPARLVDRFKLTRKEIISGKIISLGDSNLARHLCYRDGIAHIGDTESGLNSVLKSKPMAAQIDPEQKKAFAASDVYVSVHREGFKDPAGEFLRLMWNPTKELDEELMEELKEADKAFKLGLASFQVDGGLSVRVAVQFEKQEKPLKLLSRFNSGNQRPTLTGLPEGKLFFAQAVRGDGTQTVSLVRGVLQELLNSSETLRPLLDGNDQAIYFGIFSEIWKQLKGTSIAFYQNDEPGRFGLLSGMVILETDDSEAFVNQLKKLAKFSVAEGEKELAKDDIAEVRKLIKQLADVRFRVRESATNQLMLIGLPALKYLDEAIATGDADLADRAKKVRESIARTLEIRRKEPLSKESLAPLRPMLGFVQKPQVREGFEIETLVVRMTREDKAVTAALKELFGPQWDRIQVARLGKKTIFLFGSNESLLLATLNNLKANRPGLAASDFLAPFEKKTIPDRKMDLHFSIHRGTGLVNGDLVRSPKNFAENSLTSVGIIATPTRLQFDFWLPHSEFKALKKSQGW